MLAFLLASAVAAAPVEQRPQTSATASARATVRILRGAQVHFDRSDRIAASVKRQTVVRDRDGSVRNASLLEFY